MLPSREYYRLTESSYLALCPENSGHMNLGIWPSISLREAQEKLIRNVLEFHQKHLPSPPQAIVDAGSGWGGSRRLFFENWPLVPYLGINNSQIQVEHARVRNTLIPQTEYLMGDIVPSVLEVPSIDFSLFSIEAAFHFDKTRLFENLSKSRASSVTFADICVVKASATLSQNESLYQAFHAAWELDQYREALRLAGFNLFYSVEITQSVFSGWTAHLKSINPKTYAGHRKMLSRFISSHELIDAAVREKQISYHILCARRT